jgi:hypothetical protein
MLYTTDSGMRARFASSLRQLADYLDTHPTVPVPELGAEITLHANSTDDGGTAQVRHIACALGATVINETANGGHYHATRRFGAVRYAVVSIPVACMAQHYALASYDGSVTP